MGYFIGVDIGASFIKGALFDLDKFSIQTIKKIPAPQLHTRMLHSNSECLRFETNPLLYVTKTKRLLHALLRDSKKPVEGIVFSSQMHGTVLIDKNNKPLTPFIGWQDERLLEKMSGKSITWIEKLQHKLSQVDTKITGITLRSGLMGATLFWLSEKGFLAKHSDAKAIILGDFVAISLTNGMPAIESTHACGSGLFNVEKGLWDKQILDAIGINVNNLPEVVPVNYEVGVMSYKNKTIPVYVSIGDLQAAVLGSLLRPRKDLNINIGTGSQVSFIDSTFKTGNYDIRSFFDGFYLYTITHLPAGRSLNVLIHFIEDIGKKFFGLHKTIPTWQLLSNLVEKRKDSAGLTARISFYKNNATGFPTGFWDNVSEKNLTIENMLYAAYKNMAQNYKWAYDRFKQKEDISSIVCSGGLVRKSRVLGHLISVAFNRPVVMAPYEEETLIGLFVVSLVCHGDFSRPMKAVEFVRKKGLTFL